MTIEAAAWVSQCINEQIKKVILALHTANKAHDRLPDSPVFGRVRIGMG